MTRGSTQAHRPVASGASRPATPPAGARVPAGRRPSPLPEKGSGDTARGRRVVVIAVVSLLAVAGVVVGGGVWVASSLLGGGTHTPTALDVPAPDVSSSSPPPAAQSSAAPPVVVTPSATNPGCPVVAAGPRWSGNTDGTGTTGADAIRHFDFSYYVTRSGAAARTAVAPDAAVGTAAALQASIDKLAPGTTHCLLITDRGDGLWAVTLAQISPGAAAPELIYQLVQTTSVNGHAVIASIVPDKRKGQ